MNEVKVFDIEGLIEGLIEGVELKSVHVPLKQNWMELSQHVHMTRVEQQQEVPISQFVKRLEH